MSPRRAVLVAYTLSGAAGLLYEVAWVRLLTLHLGHGTAAVSTVLAAFMGGLAAGAALGGRYAPRWGPRRALGAYAGLELAIAASALLLPRAFDALRPLLVWAYADGAGGVLFGVTRVAASLGVVALPATLMGATLPLAVCWLVRDPARAGPDAGLLYAANTAGAAAGAAMTSFVLLPVFGLSRTTFVGVGLNAAAAALAGWATRSRAVPSPAPAGHAGAATKVHRGHRRRDVAARLPEVSTLEPAAAGAVLALSGFVALTYEVTWTRLCALVMGPTTYAFGLMVAVFIAGLAVGAGVGAAWSRRVNPRVALGAALLGAALGGLLVAATAGSLPVRVAALLTRVDAHFATILTLEALGLTLLLLPATIALGTAFPLALAASASPQRPVARDAAVVYAANTLGAIAGSLASGFLLVPRLGLRTTILGVAAAASVAAVALLWSRARRASWRVAAAAPALGVLTAGLWLPAWNRALLSSGAYKYAAYLDPADPEIALEAGTLLFYAEGATGTVSVRRTAGTLALAIDGKVDASNGGDMLTQKLLAHLPLLLHPSPRRVGIVGLGSGVTAGAALVHPVEEVEVIEIAPEVVRASAWFARDNSGALDDPRTRLIVGDARSHLALGRRPYDVIISEPSNPWMAGVASLFTREFFANLRARLAPGGIVCQWAHTYDISDRDLRSIVATFLSVFPAGGLWLVGDADVLLVAGEKPVDALLDNVAIAWKRPGVAADLATVGVRTPFGLLSLFVAAGPELAAYTSGAPLQTDDRMALEFTAPRGVYEAAGEDNARRLRELAEHVVQPEAVRAALAAATGADWKARGLFLLQAESPKAAYDDLARAASADPGDLETLLALERAAAPAGRLEDLLRLLTELSERSAGSVTARIAASRLLASTGQAERALAVIQEAVGLAPDDGRVLAQQASILADLGDVARLAGVVRQLEAHAPQDSETLYYRATLAFLAGKPEEAHAMARALVQQAPHHARGLTLLGASAATLGRAAEARRAFEAAIERNPRDVTAYVNLGSLELEAANPRAAVNYLLEALSLEPTSVPAREALVRAFELAGERARAARLRRRASRPRQGGP